jgi:DNA polymerase-1
MIDDGVACARAREDPDQTASPDAVYDVAYDGSEGLLVQYVTSPAALDAALAVLMAAPILALDCETTGLHPVHDTVRLLTLATQTQAYVIDLQALPQALETLALLFTDTERLLLGHHLQFDLAMLGQLGLEVDCRLFDTEVVARVCDGGERRAEGYFSLATLGERECRLAIAKDEQVSDWSGPLREEQVRYASLDALVLWPIHQALSAQLADLDLAHVAGIECDAIPLVAQLEGAGIGLDAERWLVLAETAEADLLAADAAITATVAPLLPRIQHILNALSAAWPSLPPAKVKGEGHQAERRRQAQRRRAVLEVLVNAATEPLPTIPPSTRRKEEPFNPGSDRQLMAALAAVDIFTAETNEDALTGRLDDHPLVGQILARRDARVRATTFGRAYLEQHRDPACGRIYAHYHQLGTASGRMSCSAVNVQQIPHAPAYRRCLVPDPGNVLICADHAQIELRIAAIIAGDETMLDAFRRGEDLHRLTAATISGTAPDQVSAQDRQKAKAVNFGVLFGMQAARLVRYARKEYGVKLSLEEAQAVRDAWFQTYTGIAAWHTRLAAIRGASETRTLAGRLRRGVLGLSELANTPVQGSASDGLKRGLGLLWRHRHEAPPARLVAAVHDELVFECAEADGQAVAAWLRHWMEQGMVEVTGGGLPIVVDVGVFRDWKVTPIAGGEVAR